MGERPVRGQRDGLGTERPWRRRRWGKLVGRVGEARLEDALQVKARVSEVLHVIMLMEAGLVAVIMLLLLLEVLVQVKVMVKVFVVEVKEVFLSFLSSTSFLRTRPAALGLGFWG